MIFQIRADRDVTSKAPEGAGTRRRTVRVPSGPPLTLVFGAQPTYVECDELPIEIRLDDHLITKAVAPESLDIEITVINLKAERVQFETTSEPGDEAELKAENVLEDPAGEVPPPDEDPDLKAERVQQPSSRKPRG